MEDKHILGQCEFCGKDIKQYSEDEPENPYNASYVYLDNGIPKICGGYGSSQFDYKEGFIKDIEELNRIYTKLVNGGKCLICDDCMVKYRDDKVVWFEEETIRFPERNWSDTKTDKQGNPRNNLYMQLPRKCKVFRFNDHNPQELADYLQNYKPYQENYYNGEKIEREFWVKDNEITILDCTRLKVYNFLPDTMLVIYGDGVEIEVVPEKKFYRRFVNLPNKIN